MIAARRLQGQGYQWLLHLAHYPVKQPGRRQVVAMGGEVGSQVAFDGMPQPVPLRFRGSRRGLGQLRFDCLDPDDFFRIQRGQAADEILQFADVSRPPVPLETIHRGSVDDFRRQPFGGGLGHEMPHQLRNIGRAFPQGRQPDRHHIETEIEIFAKQALPYQLQKIVMSRGNDPDIGPNWRAASNRGVLTLLQNPKQPGLGLWRHVSNLVQEKRAALGLLEPPGTSLGGTGKCPFFVSKQLALDEFTRNGGHVDGNEGAIAPATVIVERPGNQFLARPRLTRDQNRQVGTHQPSQRSVNLLHGGGSTDERKLLLRDIAIVAGIGQHRFRRLKGPANDTDQFLEIKRLWQILERPPFIGLDRR